MEEISLAVMVVSKREIRPVLKLLSLVFGIFFAWSTLAVSTKNTFNGLEEVPARHNSSFGNLRSFEINSNFLGRRGIDILIFPGPWLQEESKFVIAQDGRLLFDGTTTFDGQSLQLDQVAEVFSRNDPAAAFVVIGVHSANESGDGFIDNTQRYSEFFPKKGDRFSGKSDRTVWLPSPRGQISL